jgi:hypothetical protein
MISYMGWLKHSQSHNLYRNKIENSSSPKQMKLIIRASDKQSAHLKELSANENVQI